MPDEARGPDHTHAGLRQSHEHLGYPEHEHVWILREDAALPAPVAGADEAEARRRVIAHRGAAGTEGFAALLDAYRAAILHDARERGAGADEALTPSDLEWLPRMRLMTDSGDYVGFPTTDVQRLLGIIDRLDRRVRSLHDAREREGSS